MADEEQLEILEQGVDLWNQWRDENPDEFVDFREADLWDTELSGANLREANLGEANLGAADLSEANLQGAYLYGANLKDSNLIGANLEEADLKEANLWKSSLREANLSKADLRGSNFSEADLSRANLNQAIAGLTMFGNTDLSETLGLEEIQHEYPSTIGMDTLQLSKGKIPTTFLRGCGLSNLDIEYAKLSNPDLVNHEINDILDGIHKLRTTQSVQVSRLFISYSHADTAFVDRLEIDLNEKGIRFWRDIHDAKAGRLEKQIERAIRLNPTVLLVLSENSIQSDWVQHEVRKARALEKELGRDVLCPIALDGSWKNAPWPQRIMEQVMEYNILDFSKWEDEKVFEKMFIKLLDGLQLFYKT